MLCLLKLLQPAPKLPGAGAGPMGSLNPFRSGNYPPVRGGLGPLGGTGWTKDLSGRPDAASKLGDIFGPRKSQLMKRKTSTITQEHYAMFAIPVPVLFQLTVLHPHQDMLKTGQLVRLAEEHVGKVIFVSHEWTGTDSPDPRGSQLRCLQSLRTSLHFFFTRDDHCWHIFVHV